MSAKRILVCVTGLSPQIVTESVYALVHQPIPWVPDEIHLITTAKGAQNARLRLLSADPGWFERLRRDFDLPDVRFGEEGIHVIQDHNGRALDDIRNDVDNTCAADGIASLIRGFTADAGTEVHASIAGGRKTMGYLLGAAMSLYGRPQDRLSHVLVSPQYESHPEFFYPSPQSRVITALGPSGDALDCRDAQVWLGDIPFVRLRQLLSHDMESDGCSYAELVQRANRNLGAEVWTLAPHSRQLTIGVSQLDLTPRDTGLLMLLAACTVLGCGIGAPVGTLAPDPDWAKSVIERIGSAFGLQALPESFRDWLDDPRADHKAGFEQGLSRLERQLRRHLGSHARFIERWAPGARGRQRAYALAIPPSQFRLAVDSSADAPTPDRTVFGGDRPPGFANHFHKLAVR